MYAWLWRKLPGPFAAKLTIAVVLRSAWSRC